MLRSSLAVIVFVALLAFVLVAIVNSPARNTPGAWSFAAAPATAGGGSAGRSVAASVSALASSSIVGRPSLSADFINRVLAAYHSPAAGRGVALYQDSLTYHIDDAFALGFFFHESTFGTIGIARTTRSLGNIRCTAGWSCYGGYRSYATWEAGFLDWFQLITNVYLPRLSTVAAIVPVYAPSADHNDEHAYITAVCSAVSAWRSGQVLVS